MIRVNISDYIIDEEQSLNAALSKLNRVKVKNLFVTDKSGKLVASLTDGDIRRWMLSKGSLDARIKEFAKYNPLFAETDDLAKARELLNGKSIEALPVVDEAGKITDIIFADEKVFAIKKDLEIPVVIMAGGLGTRLYPYTKILPKPLIPIGEIPIAEHIINSFKKYGAEEFHMILNHKKNMIKAYFNEIDKDYSIDYYDEKQPLGTGGGLYLLKGKINGDFILSNCDILIDENYEKIYSYHKEKKNLITMVCSTKHYEVPYGVVEIDGSGELERMKEKPSYTFLTNTGVYIANSKVIDELEPGIKIGFPEIIQRYNDKGEKVGIYPVGEDSWMDMGQIDEMENMIKRLGV